LVYDSSPAGQDAYINAAQCALAKKDYRPFEEIIRKAIATATSGPSP
jgi:hypothetical protein